MLGYALCAVTGWSLGRLGRWMLDGRVRVARRRLGRLGRRRLDVFDVLRLSGLPRLPSPDRKCCADCPAATCGHCRHLRD